MEAEADENSGKNRIKYFAFAQSSQKKIHPEGGKERNGYGAKANSGEVNVPKTDCQKK